MNINLAGYRKVLGLTQIQMAKIVGMSATSYCKKESGKRDFVQSEMEKIKQVLTEKGYNLTLDKIFERIS